MNKYFHQEGGERGDREEKVIGPGRLDLEEGSGEPVVGVEIPEITKRDKRKQWTRTGDNSLTYGCNGDLRVALADYISWSLKNPRKRKRIGKKRPC